MHRDNDRALSTLTYAGEYDVYFTPSSYNNLGHVANAQELLHNVNSA
jgi:hypothetical protein